MRTALFPAAAVAQFVPFLFRSLTGEVLASSSRPAPAVPTAITIFEDDGAKNDTGPNGPGQCDSYDSALVEAVIARCKPEAILPSGPWCHVESVEFTTLAWVDGFNYRRLHELIGNIPAVLEDSQVGHSHLSVGDGDFQ